MPESVFVISLVERGLPEALVISHHPAVDFFVTAEELLGSDKIDNWVFRYSIVEAATAVKGELFRYIYRRFPLSTQFVYLDPDTFVYSSFDELFHELKTAPIVLTPHLQQPGNLEMELSSLKHGTFNLGFLAVSRHPEAERFINWWAERLDYACYDDIPNGIFTDQKWINLVPGFFPVNILRHPGYNFATWTLKERHLTKVGEVYYVNGQPLRFAHFSGIDKNVFRKCADLWAADNRELLSEFASDYERECLSHGKSLFSQLNWSYGNFLSGQKISYAARKCWRNLFSHCEFDPFGLSNARLYLRFVMHYSRRFLPKLIK